MGETAKRILSGLALGALALAALGLDTYHWVFLLALIMLFGLLGLTEYYRLTDRGMDGRPLRFAGYFFSVLIILGAYAQFLQTQLSAGHLAPNWLLAAAGFLYPGQSLTPLFLVLMLVCAMVGQLLLRPLDGTVYSVAVTVFGPLYTVVSVSFGLLLYALPQGMFYTVLFIVIPISCDTGAYFAGRWFGRHNAGLKVSPRKTYEGYVGGVIFTVVVALGFTMAWRNLAPAPLQSIAIGSIEMGVMAFFFSFLAIFGDLAESALKRDSRVKDSASTIPGHGGVLDLADAIFFCLPAGYLYLTLRVWAGFAL
ncbi:MAG: phosphatidate cytidylyltransferase [Leptospirales bacterium]|nr:phosphatidate cytidylyltransferase [Leptospirales bacterium]